MEDFKGIFILLFMYKNNLCNNCNKVGHYYNQCTEPIISYGLICINTKHNIREIDLLENNFGYLNYQNYNDIYKFSVLKNQISFLMVQRRYSLGYIEFIRGRYKVENTHGIINLFEQMITKEIKLIGKSTFDELWTLFWGKNKPKNHEYIVSKNKFDKLAPSLKYYVENVKSKWDMLEWGFPKGRKNKNETEIECACREFSEETNIPIKDIEILNSPPYIETIIGTNGMKYTHIYYLALTDMNGVYSVNNCEISQIGAFNYDEAYNLIRPYHIMKKKILTNIFINIIKNIM